MFGLVERLIEFDWQVLVRAFFFLSRDSQKGKKCLRQRVGRIAD